MELNGGRLERNFIKCRVLSLYALQYAFVCGNARPGLSETNCLLAQRSVREKALGSGGSWFSKKERHALFANES